MDYGQVSWNLGIRTEYRPGMELSCKMVVTNPTNIDRAYRIELRTRDSDFCMRASYPVYVDGELWFLLAAGETEEIPGSVTLDMTDCLLEAALLTIEKGNLAFASNAVTYLYQYETVLEQANELMVGQFSMEDMMSAMMPMMMLVFILAILKSLFTGK